MVGEIPAKLPHFALPPFDATTMRTFSNSALAIALLGLLEAISMAKAIAAQTRQKLDMNQQCLSEGLANFTGSFFQCIPGSGSLTRSAINQQAGASTQWSGVVSALAVALIMLQFAPYARFIPRAALAGILMVTSWKMVDWRALVYHVRATRFDAAIVAVTAVAAVAISVEFCVLIGVFMSFLLAVPRAGRMLLTEFVVSADGGIHERLPEDEVSGRILIFGLEGEMFFGSTAALERHFAHIEERVEDTTRVVVLRMKRVRNPDAVGLTLLGRIPGPHEGARRPRPVVRRARPPLREHAEDRPRRTAGREGDLPGATGAADEHAARRPSRLRTHLDTVADGRPRAGLLLSDLGPAAGVFSMARSRWSLRAAKSDRLLGPAAGVISMARSRWSLRAAKSDRLLGPAVGVFSMARSLLRWSKAGVAS